MIVAVLFLGTTSMSCSTPHEEAGASVTTIDLLAMYTAAAENAAGGADAVQARIRDQVIMVNEVFSNSGIAAQVRLVDTRKLARYTGPEGHLAAMGRIKRDDEVRKARDDAGADLVSVFVAGDRNEDGYGVGTMPLALPVDPAKSVDQAFTVLAVSKMPPHGLAHELGHNLGAGHDWLDRDVQYRSTPANRGFAAPDRSWITVMSYQDICDGCPGIAPFYSTPKKTWKSEPVGVAADADPCDPDITRRPADNTSVIASTVAAIAGYRAEKPANGARSAVLTAVAEPVEGGRAVPATPGPHANGDNVTLTAEPRPGYHFTGWLLNGSPVDGDGVSLTVTMDRSHRAVAMFEQNPPVTLAVAIEPSSAAGTVRSHGRTLPSTLSVPVGSQVTGLAAQPAPGWKLDRWQVDRGSHPLPSGKGVELLMSGNRSLTASFVRVDPNSPLPTQPVVAVDTAEATTSRRPMITGTATPDSVVTLTDGNRDLLGTTTVPGDGKWRLTPPWDLAVGSNTLYASAAKNGDTSAETIATVTVSAPTGTADGPPGRVHVRQVGELAARRGETTAVDVLLESCDTIDFAGWTLAVKMPNGWSVTTPVSVRRGTAEDEALPVNVEQDGRLAIVSGVPPLNTGPRTKGSLTFRLQVRVAGDAPLGTGNDGAIGLAEGRQISRMASLAGTVLDGG